jgi:hypothetical protein
MAWTLALGFAESLWLTGSLYEVCGLPGKAVFYWKSGADIGLYTRVPHIRAPFLAELSRVQVRDGTGASPDTVVALLP